MSEYDGDVKIGVKLEAKDVKKSAEELGGLMESSINKFAGKNANSKTKSLLAQMSNMVSKARALQNTMETLENTEVPTNEYKELTKQLERATSLRDRLLEKQITTENKLINSTEMANLKEAETALETINAEIAKMKASGKYSFKLETDMIVTKKNIKKANAALEELEKKLKLPELVLKTDAAQKNLDKLKQKMDEVREKGRAFMPGFDSAAYEKIKNDLADVNNRMRLMKSRLDEVDKSGKKVSNTMKKSSSVLKSFGGIAKSAFDKLKLSILGVTKQALKLDRMFNVKTILLYAFGIRGLFTLFQRLKSAIREGLSNMAQWNGGMNDTNTAISQLLSSLNYLKNSWGAAFAPILSVVAPILSRLIDMLAKAANYIGAFFAALTGKGSFVKAKKVMTNYAQSLQGASKAAKDQKKAEEELEEELEQKLGTYDKLKVIQQDKDKDKNKDDDLGGASDPFADMFEEVNVDETLPQKILDWIQRIKDAWAAEEWENVGRIIAEGLNAGMQIVDDWINNTFRPLGVKWSGIFARILNGLVDGLNWELLGKTVSDGIAAVFDIFNTFLETFNFKALGDGVGRALRSAFENNDMWEQLGSFWANKWNALIHFINGLASTENLGTGLGSGIATWVNNAFTKVDLKAAGQNLGLLLKQALDGLITFVEDVRWGEIAGNINDGVRSSISSISTAIMETNWQGFGFTLFEKIKEIFTNIEWTGIVGDLSEFVGALTGGIADALVGFGAAIWEELKKAWEDVKSYFIPYMDEFGNLTIEDFLQGVWDAIKGIDEWIYKNIFEPFINGFKNAFGIASPSTIMIEQGGYIIDGLWEGIKAAWEGFLALLGGLVDGIVGVFSTAWENIKNAASTAWDTTKGIGGTIINKVSELKKNVTKKISELDSTLKTKWGEMKFNAGEMWDALKTKADTVAGEIVTALGGDWEGIKNKTKEAWGAVKKYACDEFGLLKTTVVDAGAVVKSAIEGDWTGLAENSKKLWEDIKENVTRKFDLMKKGVELQAKTLVTVLGGDWESIKSKVQTSFETMKTNVLTKFEVIKTNVLPKMESLKSGLSTKWESMKTTAQTKVESLKSTISSKFQSLKNSLLNMDFSSIGSNIANGIKNGLNRAWESVTTTASNLVGGLRSTANRVLRINSPSKVFQEIGQSVDEGLALGIKDDTGDVLAQIDAVANKMSDGFKVPDIVTGKVVPASQSFTNALAKSVTSDMNNDSDNTTDHPPIILQLNGRQIAEVVWDEEDKKYKQYNGYVPRFA